MCRRSVDTWPRAVSANNHAGATTRARRPGAVREIAWKATDRDGRHLPGANRNGLSDGPKSIGPLPVNLARQEASMIDRSTIRNLATALAAATLLLAAAGAASAAHGGRGPAPVVSVGPRGHAAPNYG